MDEEEKQFEVEPSEVPKPNGALPPPALNMSPAKTNGLTNGVTNGIPPINVGRSAGGSRAASPRGMPYALSPRGSRRHIATVTAGTKDAPTDNKKKYEVGDVVLLHKKGVGIVRYMGFVEFSKGDWIGVELSGGPYGQNDGSVRGTRYFDCQPKHGLFVKESNIKRKIPPEELLRKLVDLNRLKKRYEEIFMEHGIDPPELLPSPPSTPGSPPQNEMKTEEDDKKSVEEQISNITSKVFDMLDRVSSDSPDTVDGVHIQEKLQEVFEECDSDYWMRIMDAILRRTIEENRDIYDVSIAAIQAFRISNEDFGGFLGQKSIHVWSARAVRMWLRKLKLDAFKQVFAKMDGKTICLLSREEMIERGLPPHRTDFFLQLRDRLHFGQSKSSILEWALSNDRGELFGQLFNVGSRGRKPIRDAAAAALPKRANVIMAIGDSNSDEE